MIRIAGVILPHKKHIVIALRSVYGIGATLAKEICSVVGVAPSVKVCDLSEEIITKIQKKISDYEVEGDLRRRVSLSIKRLKEIKCYRGLRHRLGLPVRGQNTKTNARTRKGKKKGKK